MPVVGAWARVEANDSEAIRRELCRLAGVETFDLADPGKVGLLIEAGDLDAAHDVLTRAVPSVRGVLCAWPVSVYLDDDDRSDEKDAARSAR